MPSDAGLSDDIHPSKRVWIGDPEETWGPFAMEFRLTYAGRLAGSGSATADHKQDMRRVFHRQLNRLWDSHPYFKDSEAWTYRPPIESDTTSRKAQLASLNRRGNYRYVPIVLRELKLLCDLDILFLRPDVPGEIVKSADIDNRLKTLLDALKMPGNDLDLGRTTTPGASEDPFFVLLEDDSLVTRLAVETDTLLEPTGPGAGVHDARLVITVRLTPYHRLMGTMGI